MGAARVGQVEQRGGGAALGATWRCPGAEVKHVWDVDESSMHAPMVRRTGSSPQLGQSIAQTLSAHSGSPPISAVVGKGRLPSASLQSDVRAVDQKDRTQRFSFSESVCVCVCVCGCAIFLV